MIGSIKELKKIIDARAASEEAERDEEGRVIIEMTVLKDEAFLSDFSAGKRLSISSEMAEFLRERAEDFLPKEPICLKIYSDCIDEDEQISYSKALREYYVRQYSQTKRDLRRNSMISAVMAAIGMAVIAVVLIFSFLDMFPIITEVLDIFAWVFLWEAVDLFFLQRAVMRAERNRCLRFADAKIEYLPRPAASEKELR